MRIFVCAGTFEFKQPYYAEQASKLGEMLAKKGHIYAQGGSLSGLMGATLRSYSELGGKVEFIIPEIYVPFDKPKLDEISDGKAEFFVVKNEAERLKKIITYDKIIIMPGGTGTLEEFLYSNETKRNHEHNAEIILVNINGYYDGILQQFQNIIGLGGKTDAFFYKVVKSVEEIKL